MKQNDKNLAGKCAAIKSEDINCTERSIHICRNAVKTAAGQTMQSVFPNEHRHCKRCS